MYEVLTAVLLKIQVFWEVTVCHSVSDFWCHKGQYCLHIHSQAVKRWICATVKIKVKHRNYTTKTTVSHPGRLEWILLRPQAAVTYGKNPMFQWLPLSSQISDFHVLDTADPWHFSPNIFQIWDIPNMSQQTCFRHRRLMLCFTKHIPPHPHLCQLTHDANIKKFHTFTPFSLVQEMVNSYLTSVCFQDQRWNLTSSSKKGKVTTLFTLLFMIFCWQTQKHCDSEPKHVKHSPSWSLLNLPGILCTVIATISKIILFHWLSKFVGTSWTSFAGL